MTEENYLTTLLLITVTLGAIAISIILIKIIIKLIKEEI